LQELYDFKFDIKEYELEINAILFEEEQQSIKAKAQEQGELDIIATALLIKCWTKLTMDGGIMVIEHL
jgi:hypothetical protein